MSEVASELRRLRKEHVRLNRKLAMGRLPGIVAQRDPDKRTVRLDLGTDPDSGRTVLSPWVRVQSNSAGAFKAFVLPSIGEQMYLHSASGVIGADSVAVFGTFTDANPPPRQGADEAVVLEHGGTRIDAKDGEAKTSVGGTVTKSTPGSVSHKSQLVKHDAKKTRTTGAIHLATGGTTV